MDNKKNNILITVKMLGVVYLVSFFLIFSCYIIHMKKYKNLM